MAFGLGKQMIYSGFGNKQDVNSNSAYIFAYVYYHMHACCLSATAPGERMIPARWLSSNPGGCDDDEEIKAAAKSGLDIIHVKDARC